MTLKLDSDVVTLIGLNESGKTTILEAIYCFEYGAENLEAINPEIASVHDRAQWIPIGKRANFDGSIKISPTIALDAHDRYGLRKYLKETYGLKASYVQSEIKITESYEFENSRFVKKGTRTWSFTLTGTTGRQRKARVYDGKSDEWQGAVRYLAERLPKIWYFPNFLFELPSRFLLVDPEELTEDPWSTDEEVDKNRFYRTLFDNMIRQIVPGATLQTLIDRLQSSRRDDQRSLPALLLSMSRSVTTIVFDGWNRIFGQTASSGQEVDIRAGADPKGVPYLELRIKTPEGYYDLSERSVGFRWFFTFLLMTSFHGERPRFFSKPLFLLDEPASNLHSSAQAELLKSFENLTDHCSLVYATHSHHLINVRWLDSSYVIHNAALGSFEIADYLNARLGIHTSIRATKYRRFAAEHPSQLDHIQPVLDVLNYQPSMLEPVPNVVLVEGKSDYYLIRYVTEVLGINTQLRMAPGTGAGSLDCLIQLHIAWGKTFVVLLDGDEEGVKQQERYTEKYGPILEERCILLPDACGDQLAKEGEDLLSATDREAVIAAIYSTEAQRPTAKKALREAVIELYARKEAVALESTTMARFRSLMELLSERLDS